MFRLRPVPDIEMDHVNLLFIAVCFCFVSAVKTRPDLASTIWNCAPSDTPSWRKTVSTSLFGRTLHPLEALFLFFSFFDFFLNFLFFIFCFVLICG